MAMVQMSNDPFGATPPSFAHALGTPPPGTSPFDSVYGDSPRSTTHLVQSSTSSIASPDWGSRRFPNVPTIRIQSASTEDHSPAAERERVSSVYSSLRSSYAESNHMVPLETPEEERYIRNPFVDPATYASSDSANASPNGSLIDVPAGSAMLKDVVEVRLASRTNSRLTMKSLKADVVASTSPVDAIDRFWDIPSPGLRGNRLSASTPSSEQSFLRSVSPGPGPSSRYF